MTTPTNPTPRKRTPRTSTPMTGSSRDSRYDGKHVEVLRHDQGLAAKSPFPDGTVQFVMGNGSEIAVQYRTKVWSPAELAAYRVELVERWGEDDVAKMFWHMDDSDGDDPGDLYLRGYFGDVYGPFEDVDGIIAWFAGQEYAVIDRRNEEGGE